MSEASMLGDVDSLLSGIRRKIDREQARGDDDDVDHHPAGALAAAADPRPAAAAAAARPVPDRPLNEWVQKMSEALVDARIAAFVSESLADGTPSMDVRSARGAFGKLVDELQHGATARVARASAGPAVPQHFSDAASKALGDLRRAKVDMTIAYERALGDELHRHAGHVNGAVDAITQGAAAKLAHVDELSAQWDERAEKLAQAHARTAQEKMAALESEWDRKNRLSAGGALSGGGGDVTFDLVREATRDQPLTDRITRFMEMASAAPDADSERSVAKARLGMHVAESIRNEMRASDDRMQRVVDSLDDVSRRRATALRGASSGDDAVGALRALDTEHGVLHAEALALAGRRTRMYRQLSDALTSAHESNLALRGGGAPAAIPDAESLLRRAHTLEAQQRSTATVKWRLKDAASAELLDARRSVVDAAVHALTELRGHASRAFAQRVRTLDAQFAGPMRALTRDAAAIVRGSDDPASTEPWERSLDGEQAVVRQQILSKIRGVL